ncbi:MAG: DNA polymerase III subunit delta [Oscillospiraceae bacterium]|jgi:DNA polymerase-3 subunit delta|nr:DNA polymerase III subunit delta [Oscillospiraceae bacterium]
MQRLKQEIKSSALAPLYFFYGEEAYLREHYLKLMRKGVDDFDYKRLDGQTCGAEDVIEAAQALPMTSARVFTEVRDLDVFKLKDSDAERIAELIAAPPEDATTVFVYSALEWKPDKRKKLWKTIEKQARLVEFKPQNDKDLSEWIERRFHALNKTISRADALFLIRYAGRSMTDLIGEIEKIAAYSTGGAIGQSDIRAVGTPHLEAMDYEAFNLAEAIINGDYENSSRRLAVLLELGQEAIPLIYAWGSKLRQGYAASVRSGRSAKLQWYAECVKLCAEADLRCKSSNTDDRVIVLDLFARLIASRRARLGR